MFVSIDDLFSPAAKSELEARCKALKTEKEDCETKAKAVRLIVVIYDW